VNVAPDGSPKKNGHVRQYWLRGRSVFVGDDPESRASSSPFGCFLLPRRRLAGQPWAAQTPEPGQPPVDLSARRRDPPRRGWERHCPPSSAPAAHGVIRPEIPTFRRSGFPGGALRVHGEGGLGFCAAGISEKGQTASCWPAAISVSAAIQPGKPSCPEHGESVQEDVGYGRPECRKASDGDGPHRPQSFRSRLMVLEGMNWLALKKRVSLMFFKPTRVFTF